MMLNTSAKELVLAVIRGNLPLTALNDVGIYFEVRPNETKTDRETDVILHQRSEITVVPEPVDIAAGLLAYSARREILRQWSALVLGAAELIDLSELEKWPEGDEILSGVWDANFEWRCQGRDAPIMPDSRGGLN